MLGIKLQAKEVWWVEYIKGCRIWNVALVGKLLWQLNEKKDHLWVRWVHGVYIKQDGTIWDHNPPINSSWYWRKLNALKSGMVHWYQNNRYHITPNGEYLVTKSYNVMLTDLDRLK